MSARYVVSCRKRDPSHLARGGRDHPAFLNTPKRAGTYALLQGEDKLAFAGADTDAGERADWVRGEGQRAALRSEQHAVEDQIARRLLELGALVLYVHGYNTNPQEAWDAAVRIQDHLDRNGVKMTVVAFDWPSAGHLADYFPDQRAAGQFGSYAFINLLLSLQRVAPAGGVPVHCIAHSMGTYVVTRALSTIATLDLETSLPQGRKALTEVAFMQPDIDFDVLCSGYQGGVFNSSSYLEIADGYGATEMVDRLTIYHTTNDMALFASLFKNRTKRLGAYGPGLEGKKDARAIMAQQIRLNVHVVNCDEWCVFDFMPSHSHSHFLECPRMMADVAAVLTGAAGQDRVGTDAPRWDRLNARFARPGLLRRMAAWWKGLGSAVFNPIAVFLVKWKKRVQTYWGIAKTALSLVTVGGTGAMAWHTGALGWRLAFAACVGLAVGALIYLPVWVLARRVQNVEDA